MACIKYVVVGLAMMLGMTSWAHAAQTPGVSLLFEKVEDGVAHFGVRIYVGQGRATFWRANLERHWDRNQNRWVQPELRTLLDWSGSTGIDPAKIVIDWPYPQGVRGQATTWTGYNEEVVLIGKVPLQGQTASLKLRVTYSECQKLKNCERKTEPASLEIPSGVRTDLAVWQKEIPIKQDPCGMRAIYEEFEDPERPGAWYGHVVMKRSERCMASHILALFEDGRAVADFEKGVVGFDHSFGPDMEGGRKLDLIGQHVTMVFGASVRVNGANHNRFDIYQYRFRIEPGRLKPGTRL